jgi:hypothetical protein
MDLIRFNELLTPIGQDALQAAMGFEPKEADFLPLFDTLCKRYPRELARTALETAILRAEGRSKFPQAECMYFTRQALEQASSWQVSSYRANRFGRFSGVLDMGCSIGGDTLALASRVTTTGVDHDPLRISMARANRDELELRSRARFVLADLKASLPFTPTPDTALFFDPSRRRGHRRLFSVDRYSPPLYIIKDWLMDFPALGVKISPGVKLSHLRPYDAEVEFISLRGELKEAVLWFGPLKTVTRRATLLPGEHTMTASGEVILPVTEPRAYLYEPDPAILRAGLVKDLGILLDGAQLDPEIAYLTSDSLFDSPFARVWEVEDWMPFQLKRLRTALRQRNVGHVVVKKRGSPIQPEELIHNLRLKGEESRVLFLTRTNDGPVAIICGEEIRGG